MQHPMSDVLHLRHHWRSPLVFLSLVAIALTVLAGCSAGLGGSKQLADQQKFVYPNINGYEAALPTWDPTKPDPTVSGFNLDPAFMNDSASLNIVSMIQRQLVTFNNAMQIIPDAAASWDHSPDALKWTFHLKDGLKWSDGTPMTSKDFLLGIKHALDPHLCTTDGPLNNPNPALRAPCDGVGSNSSQVNYIFLQYIAGATDYAQGKAQSISGIDATDDHTLVFTLSTPVGFFLQLMATPASTPLETSAFGKYGFNYITHFTEGIGQSGPFVIKEWLKKEDQSKVDDPKQATEIHFVQNKYWSDKQLTLTDVYTPFVDSSDTAYPLYQQGKIDFTTVPSHDYPLVQDLPDFHQLQELLIRFFAPNTQKAPFDNLSIRQAFDLAFNKQYLVDTVFQGAFSPTNHIIPLGLSGYKTDLVNPPQDKGTSALSGDQDTAKSLIQQVGQDCVNNPPPLGTNQKDWCKYVIGTPDPNTPSKYGDSTSLINSSCPAFKVHVDANGKLTDRPAITVYLGNTNQDLRNFLEQTVQVWKSVLCLNVAFDDTTYKNTSAIVHAMTQQNGNPLQMWMLGWIADYPDPEDYTTAVLGPGASSNYGNFNDPDINAKMHAAGVEPDAKKRAQLYSDIEQSLVNQVAWIPFAQVKFIYRVNLKVVGYSILPAQFVSDQAWADIYVTK
jgi:oligopeptide transport system substrate-binding protein